MKTHQIKKSSTRKTVLKILGVLILVVIILVNPIPVLVSASEDTFGGFFPSFTSATSIAPAAGHQQISADTVKLNKYMTVESAFLGLTDNVSIYFKDLNSGGEFSILPDKSWIPASAIKAYVAADAFYQRRLGTIDFNSTVTIVSDNVVPNPLETDEFPRLREGAQVTIGQVVQAMIVQSDNTAYNTLLDILDRRNVMSYIKGLGIENTIVGEKLNVDDNQQRRDSNNPGYQYNVTTAADYEKLFELMYSHKIPDSDELLAIFRRQKLNSMIPALIPQDVPIAHKTGEWAPIYHDGGIVYKDGSPFILSLFSNSNNPRSIAKLASVAYYQDPGHVDTSLTKTSQGQNKTTSIDKIYVADRSINQNVLAATTDINSSAVTSSDLGITSSDLGINLDDYVHIPYTLITPASPLYGIKILIENIELSNATKEVKPILELSFARERLSELKSIASVPDPAYVSKINSNLENNVYEATALAEVNPNKDQLLLEAKQVNDSHFIVLGTVAKRVGGNSKEGFIDNTFKVLQNNKQTVAPILMNSPLALSSKTEPVVGTIKSISDNVATVTLDNGKATQVVLNDSAKIRSFNEDNNLNTSNLVLGDKIAVIGKARPDGKITPVFIMNKVPHTIPKTRGVVVEIQPQSNLIKIENNKGQLQDVIVDPSTNINSKDTGVSIEGIKAGSIITVVGSSSDNSRTSVPLLGTPTGTGLSHGILTSTGLPQGVPTSIAPINAKSIKIDVNGSGKSEVIQTKHNQKSDKEKGKAPPTSAKPEAPKPNSTSAPSQPSQAPPKPAATPVPTK